MKLTFKTVSQQTFHLDAEPTDTVADLKQKISTTQGHPIASQKIIYSGEEEYIHTSYMLQTARIDSIYAGKILSDDKTVESCNIKERDFLVVMVSKVRSVPRFVDHTCMRLKVIRFSQAKAAAAPKAAPVPAASTSTPVAQSVVPPPPAAAPAVETPASTPAPAPAASSPAAAPATPSSGGAFDPSASFLSGPALQSTISNIMEMGFEREQILRALKASFNNPERAVEYLMTVC